MNNIPCPYCKNNMELLIGYNDIYQCNGCKTVFGTCTKRAKEKLIGHRMSKNPKITSDCYYVHLMYIDDGEVREFKGWYNFKENQIESVKIPNGVANEENQPITRE